MMTLTYNHDMRNEKPATIHKKEPNQTKKIHLNFFKFRAYKSMVDERNYVCTYWSKNTYMYIYSQVT